MDMRPTLATADPFSNKPFLVFWELTRACALACSHCRAEAQHHRDPNELSPLEALRLVDQLAELAPPMLILTGGDPMMRPDVLEIAARASAAGIRVGLSPSATARLVNYDFHKIRAAGIERMSLSLDGATRETHDSFRGVTGTFDRTVKAIELAREAGISLQINTTLTRSNLHEFNAFRDLMFEWKPEMWSVFILVPTGRAGAGRSGPERAAHPPRRARHARRQKARKPFSATTCSSRSICRVSARTTSRSSCASSSAASSLRYRAPASSAAARRR